MYDFPTSTSRIRLPGMAILESTKKLIANLPYDFLLNKGMSLLGFSQLRAKITSSTVLHDDVNSRVGFINDAINVLDYIGMRKFLEEVYFSDKLLLFSATHFLEIDFFPHQYLSSFPTSDPPNHSKRALSDLFHGLVLLHLNLI